MPADVPDVAEKGVKILEGSSVGVELVELRNC